MAVKLQSVKSTTVAVRGSNPSFEQEFILYVLSNDSASNHGIFSETNRLDTGLILELWTKGVLWDKLLGVHFISLHNVQYSAAAGPGKWLQIDQVWLKIDLIRMGFQELETRNGQPVRFIL